MTRFIGFSLVGFACLLYLLSAVTFIDYMYSLTIRDTVTAVENAFGTLVILVFLLVLAKFSLKAGKNKLQEVNATESGNVNNSGSNGDAFDTGQQGTEEETEK